MFSVTRSARRSTDRNVGGFTTVESIVALIVFAVGILGAVSTIGLSVRSMRAGASAGAAARLLGTISDSLIGAVITGAGRCATVSAGARDGGHGIHAQWATSAVMGGLEVRLTVARPSLGRPRSDTITVRLPCR